MAMLPPSREVPTTPAIQVADIKDKYELFDEEKGRGAFSRVVRGKLRATGEERAVKIMQRSILVGKKAQMVAHEKEVLRRTRHPHIIHLHECLTTPDSVYMVMDLMQGDLFDYIVARKKLAEPEAARFIGQLLSAVSYLHESCVIHRDVKPENILIGPGKDGRMEVKLADFGLAKVVQEWEVKSTPCGTSFYIAPEIIRGIEANGARPLCTNREDVKFVDVWSCGIVLFVMLAGRPPFYGQVKTSAERRQLLGKIDRGVLFPDAQWASISDPAKDLVMRLLTHEPSMRCTAAEASHHPFIKQFAPEAVPSAAVGGDVADRAQLGEEMNAMQEDVREAGDEEGDTTVYGAKVKAATATPARGGMKMPALRR